jgi:FtsZ-binding cell division protein ZapB
MNKELTNKLFNKYPKIFAQKNLPMSESLVCFGFEHGDGWYDILDNLCEKIQQHVDESGCSQVEAVQMKEKYGGLRFYVHGGDKYIDDLIYQAEEESYETCEACGSKENVTSEGSWITTLCQKCRNKS